MLGRDDVPGSWARATAKCANGAPVLPPAVRQTRIVAPAPNEGWKSDLPKLAATGEVDLLLPVRGPRHLRPLRRQLDASPIAGARTGRTNAARQPSPSRTSSPRPGDRPRRRGLVDAAKAVAQLLADLGLPKTHSQPHGADDDPYSEARFKTLKYGPAPRAGSPPARGTASQRLLPLVQPQHHHPGQDERPVRRPPRPAGAVREARARRSPRPTAPAPNASSAGPRTTGAARRHLVDQDQHHRRRQTRRSNKTNPAKINRFQGGGRSASPPYDVLCLPARAEGRGGVSPHRRSAGDLSPPRRALRM